MGENENRRLRLSQCMIVKNEEKNLPRALGWGKGLVWEQIVVDTGSSDGTKDLAKKMGAKVISYEWQEDFAAAKNFAVSQAEGDWIAFLDADEFLEPEGTERLKLLLEQIQDRDFDAISTDWEQLDEEGHIFAHGTQTRIFRRSPDICYSGRIHEQLVSRTGRPLKTADAGGQIPIYHTGYQKGEQQRKKTAWRNKKLLLKELEEKPEDSAVLGYLGDTCYDEGEREDACRWYSQALRYMPDLVPDQDQRSSFTITRLLQMAAQDRNEKELIRLYKKGTARIPKEPDLDYVTGLYYVQTEDFPKACQYLGQAFEKLKKFGSSNRAHCLGAEKEDAAAVYAKCLYRAGKWKETIRQAEDILKRQPWDMSVLSVFLLALSEEGEDWEKDVKKIYRLEDMKTRLFLYQCAFQSGVFSMASVFWDQYLSAPEKAALTNRGMDMERRV